MPISPLHDLLMKRMSALQSPIVKVQNTTDLNNGPALQPPLNPGSDQAGYITNGQDGPAAKAAVTSQQEAAQADQDAMSKLPHATTEEADRIKIPAYVDTRSGNVVIRSGNTTQMIVPGRGDVAGALSSDGGGGGFVSGSDAADTIAGGGGTSSIVTPQVRGGDLVGVFKPSAKGAITTQLGKDLVKDRNQLEQLLNVQKAYRPEFLNKNRIANMWYTNLKDAMGGEGMLGSLLGQASPDELQQLRDFSRFRERSTAYLNSYIHDMTGAQMSFYEAKRLASAVPSAGTSAFYGLMDADGPEVYNTKLNETINLLKKAVARHSYYLRKGIPYDPERAAKEMPLPFADLEYQTPERWHEAYVLRANELAKDPSMNGDPEAIARKLEEELGPYAPNQ